MIILSQEVKDKLGIENKPLKQLEKFLTYLHENDKVSDEFSLEFLLKYISKSKILELIEHKALISRGNNFILSFLIVNFISDNYDENKILPISVSSISLNSDSPSCAITPSPEEPAMSQYTARTYEESLRMRQLKSLEKNLKISQEALIDRLIKDKVLRTTFGFDKDWLVHFGEETRKQGSLRE